MYLTIITSEKIKSCKVTILSGTVLLSQSRKVFFVVLIPSASTWWHCVWDVDLRHVIETFYATNWPSRLLDLSFSVPGIIIPSLLNRPFTLSLAFAHSWWFPSMRLRLVCVMFARVVDHFLVPLTKWHLFMVVCITFGIVPCCLPFLMGKFGKIQPQ